MQKEKNLRKVFEKLSAKKQNFIDRGEECAELTLPAIFPSDGFSDATQLYTPFQSVGARGVNNLASKLLLLLLPPNQPFFRLSLSGKTKDELDKQPDLKSNVEKSLAKIERQVMSYIEQNAIRVPVFEALKHLLITGNVLLHLPKNSKLKIFNIKQYCVNRDADGNLLQIAIKESVSPLTLDKETRTICNLEDKETDIDLYTNVERAEDGKFYVEQQCNNVTIPSSTGSYKEEDLPFIPLRMIRVETEDYGRSYVEEFIGDLKSLEGLSKALLQSAAACSKIVFLVKPNATTKKRDLVESANGDIITGNKEDIDVLQVEKYYDFQFVEKTINSITERLSYVFLVQSSIVRQAERVTAEEIRKLANELESALGGIYSLLSQEFQIPLVNLLMKQLGTKGLIPKLPKDSITPTIITGIEALGRGNDLVKIREFITDIGQLAKLNPTAVQLININDLIIRIATSHGIDTEGLIKDQEQVAAEQQQQNSSAMANNLVDQTAGPVAKGMVEGIRDGSIDGQALAQQAQQYIGNPNGGPNNN
jgi:hypothetical protein